MMKNKNIHTAEVSEIIAHFWMKITFEKKKKTHTNKGIEGASKWN